jgi:hypothetical protein
LPTSQTTSRFENFGDASVQGIETETRIDINKGNYVFINKDLRNQLFGDKARSAEELKKTGSKITRIIRKLRAHRLISKIPRSTRYKVTEKGYRILGASLKMKNKFLPMNMKNAA